MLRGLYAASSAMDAAFRKQEVTAQNLANASVPGYRQRGLTFQTFDRVLGRAQEPIGDLLGTAPNRDYYDFRPGGIESTGNPLDFALQGDGFFVLQGPDAPLYTRNGTFRLDRQGQIVSQAGYPLLGSLGPFVVPPNAVNITVSAEGIVSADGRNLGTIRRVRFADPQALIPAGITLFKAALGAGLPDLQDSTEKVLQGMKESSNVQPASAMVQLISDSRYFEASQRVLRAIAESIQLNTRPQNS